MFWPIPSVKKSPTLTCTRDVVVLFMCSNPRRLPNLLQGECQALIHTHRRPLLSHMRRLANTTSTYYPRARVLREGLVFIEVFICCCAEPRLADSHKPAVKGKVFFFDGGVFDLLWSLPGIFAAAARLHYDTASTRQPPNTRGPRQTRINAISVWIHSGGLCLWDVESERVKRRRGRSALKTVTWLFSLHVLKKHFWCVLPNHFVKLQFFPFNKEME